MHSKKREEDGECCQQEDQEKAEQDTYEHCVRIEEQPKLQGAK
jgi:hypothetical protein